MSKKNIKRIKNVMTGGKVKREKLYLHFHDERGCGVVTDE